MEVSGGEEDQSMLLIYAWKWRKETHQTLFLKGKKEGVGVKGSILGGVN
jgi:hypothetical protein